MPTGSFLLQRRIVSTMQCVIYNLNEDSAIHILFDCPYACQLWALLGDFASAIGSRGRSAYAWFANIFRTRTRSGCFNVYFSLFLMESLQWGSP